jgi:hypothetical protein
MIMTVAELMPMLRKLSRFDKLQVIQLLKSDLTNEEDLVVLNQQGCIVGVNEEPNGPPM